MTRARNHRQLDMVEAIRLYQNGVRPSDIARRYHISRSVIVKRLLQSGVRIRCGGADGVPDDEAEKIVEAYKSHTLADVSRIFNHDVETTKKVLARNNVTIRTRGSRVGSPQSGDSYTSAWRVAAAEHYYANGLYAVAALYAPEPMP